MQKLKSDSFIDADIAFGFDWHCGATYFSKQATYIKIGDDYVHLYDEEEKEFDLPFTVKEEALPLFDYLSKF